MVNKMVQKELDVVDMQKIADATKLQWMVVIGGKGNPVFFYIYWYHRTRDFGFVEGVAKSIAKFLRIEYPKGIEYPGLKFTNQQAFGGAEVKITKPKEEEKLEEIEKESATSVSPP